MSLMHIAPGQMITAAPDAFSFSGRYTSSVGISTLLYIPFAGRLLSSCIVVALALGIATGKVQLFAAQTGNGITTAKPQQAMFF